MKAGPNDVSEAALQAICTGQASNRVSATILGVVWKLKRVPLRERALRCAKSLPAASLRLRLWLADEASTDKDPKVRRAGVAAAALALREGGPQYLRLGRLYLKDGDPELRRAMLDAIVERPPSAPGFLFSLLEHHVRDPEPMVRAAAATAVRLTASKPALAAQALKVLLADADGRVRLSAIRAASKLDSRGGQLLEGALAKLIGDRPPDEALEAVQVAGRFALRQALRKGTAHHDGRVRVAALEALLPSLMAAEALALLEEALRDQQPSVREVALRAAGGLGPTLGEPLAKLIGRASFSTEPSVRAAAFCALGRLRGKAAIAGLQFLRRAAQHPSEGRRRLAMAALGELATHHAAAADLLSLGAEDSALDVRDEAQRALAAYLGGSADMLPTLWALLLGSERCRRPRASRTSPRQRAPPPAGGGAAPEHLGGDAHRGQSGVGAG